jgi:hypothetical protein
MLKGRPLSRTTKPWRRASSARAFTISTSLSVALKILRAAVGGVV